MKNEEASQVSRLEEEIRALKKKLEGQQASSGGGDGERGSGGGGGRSSRGNGGRDVAGCVGGEGREGGRRGEGEDRYECNPIKNTHLFWLGFGAVIHTGSCKVYVSYSKSSSTLQNCKITCHISSFLLSFVLCVVFCALCSSVILHLFVLSSLFFYTFSLYLVNVSS